MLKVLRTLVPLLAQFFFSCAWKHRFSFHHLQPWVSSTQGNLLSWSSPSRSSEAWRLLRDFLARIELFSNWDERKSILYTCKPIPPPLCQLATTTPINQPTSVWQQMKLPRSLWCQQNKGEKKATFSMKLNLFDLNDYSYFWDYVLATFIYKNVFYIMMVIWSSVFVLCL